MADTLTMASTHHALHPGTTTTSCPSCGSSLDHEFAEAQQRIAELETHVRMLNEKATAAVEKWAGYEDELAKLRSQVRANNNRLPGTLNTDMTTVSSPTGLTPDSAGAPVTPIAASPSRTPSILQTGTERITALLSPRKSQANLRNNPAPPTPLRSATTPIPASSSTSALSSPPQLAGGRKHLDSPLPPTPGGSAGETQQQQQELLNELTREKSLRKEAQARLTATSKEVEELSAALFEQANEMVADERRARAKLEERVGELEKRDVEKRRRLERLEGAMERIERVRNILAEDSGTRT